ncbi:MBL fold metallo-hydrolase [Treponema sp.]|uniref:MBL fold metallo-hydrolase n=1 Tax=Treponema sp. TaxID=166 RepID=UPI00298DE1F5|nr:MBL fold metallo-hydrolase [Treponema sp.]MCQ2240203.1 MBL fold metallo-hydrolase [Treponema sp.]
MKILLCVIFLAAFFSMQITAIPFLPGVGGKPSEADRKDYLQRAENFDGKEFHNENEVVFINKVQDEDPLRISAKPAKPEDSLELPVKTPEFLTSPSERDFTFTWYGHSTFMIQMHGKNILIDPVFTERISPVSWAGPKKFTKPSVGTEDLPEIDFLVLSHDHYDHLDYKFIREIDEKVKKYIVPLGVESHLKKWKVKTEKIINLSWWEEFSEDGLKITAAPAQHFSGRWITGRNQTLWCGYVFKDEYRQIFYSGDSGYGEHFKKIHEKFGDFELAILECGQYNKRWPMIHSFPEETVQEAMELGAKITVPVHWGAIVLSTNGWDDSVLRFVKAAEQNGIDYLTPYLCETVKFPLTKSYKEKWFE